ncbi:MAG: desulfoferrodoxin [Vallitalea sp.]|jgi:superoxide reductase|nr:desulfoferrodoxin [Vallitalea sp.]
MTKELEIRKCNKCGNVTEIFHGEGADLVCCGQKMESLEEQTADTATEKHVPFIEEIEDGYKVVIGENQLHPMIDTHYIEWIELIVDNNIYRKKLQPNDKPEAIFKVEKSNNVIAREYCNIHGLWKSNIQ